jgi:pimeloyl-ACP methyl ester carboxylesterase
LRRQAASRRWESILGVRLPLFVLTATADRVVDSGKVRAYLDPLLRSYANRFMEIDAGHAVQFEQPDVLANALIEFIHSPRRILLLGNQFLTSISVRTRNSVSIPHLTTRR